MILANNGRGKEKTPSRLFHHRPASSRIREEYSRPLHTSVLEDSTENRQKTPNSREYRKIEKERERDRGAACVGDTVLKKLFRDKINYRTIKLDEKAIITFSN